MSDHCHTAQQLEIHYYHPSSRSNSTIIKLTAHDKSAIKKPKGGLKMNYRMISGDHVVGLRILTEVEKPCVHLKLAPFEPHRIQRVELLIMDRLHYSVYYCFM